MTMTPVTLEQLNAHPRLRKVAVFITVSFILFTWCSVTAPLPINAELAEYFSRSKQTQRAVFPVYMLVFTASQLFWGVYSDRVGRRRLVLLGLCIAALGSLVSALSASFALYSLGRCLQGAGAGFGSVLSRSILLDLSRGPNLTRRLAWISVMFCLAPPLTGWGSPHLLHWFGWQSVYLWLAIWAGLMMVLVFFFLPETHVERQRTIHLRVIGALHVRRLVRKHAPNVILAGGLSLVTAAAILLGASYLYLGMNLWGVLLPMALYAFAMVHMTSVANGLALNEVAEHSKGAASAMITIAMSGSVAAVSGVLALLPTASVWPLVFVMSATCVLNWALLFIIWKRRRPLAQ